MKDWQGLHGARGGRKPLADECPGHPSMEEGERGRELETRLMPVYKEQKMDRFPQGRLALVTGHIFGKQDGILNFSSPLFFF